MNECFGNYFWEKFLLFFFGKIKKVIYFSLHIHIVRWGKWTYFVFFVKMGGAKSYISRLFSFVFHSGFVFGLGVDLLHLWIFGIFVGGFV
jgi:hypothetical protein